MQAAQPREQASITRALSVFRRIDWLIIAAYSTIFSVFLWFSLQHTGAAGSVVIQASGVEYRYSFDENRSLEFDGPEGEVVIEINTDGMARFVHSDCKDQLCVLHGWLSNSGDWAACLPNRVILRVEETEADPRARSFGIDATAF